jgi:ATP-dependent DNA helicase HFM1/MER3
MNSVLNYQIFSICTPEKLEFLSRKWRDMKHILDDIGLFLIDEIHVLNENRGSCLEGLVTRFKAMQKLKNESRVMKPISDLRILALSATVINMKDISQWLEASCFEFGEEYRPVPVTLQVIGYPQRQKDFLFDNSLNFRLYEMIVKYSSGKPVLIFCSSRKGCAEAGKQILSDSRRIGGSFIVSESQKRRLERAASRVNGMIIHCR